MESITQIYNLTQGEHKNTTKTLAIEASLSTTLVDDNDGEDGVDDNGSEDGVENPSLAWRAGPI
jgi:hypothetical protein